MGQGERWHRQMVRIPEATPSHDQHIEIETSEWSIKGELLSVAMHNANAGHQSVLLEREDVADLIAWLQSWQEAHL